jgi:hypothetical protein
LVIWPVCVPAAVGGDSRERLADTSHGKVPRQ